MDNYLFGVGWSAVVPFISWRNEAMNLSIWDRLNRLRSGSPGSAPGVFPGSSRYWMDSNFLGPAYGQVRWSLLISVPGSCIWTYRTLQKNCPAPPEAESMVSNWNLEMWVCEYLYSHFFDHLAPIWSCILFCLPVFWHSSLNHYRLAVTNIKTSSPREQAWSTFHL